MDRLQELRDILEKKTAERKKKRIVELQTAYLSRINSRLRKRQDDNGDQWITTNNGAHILISESGEVKAGMGGKFNGQNISDVSGVEESTASRLSKNPIDSVQSGKSNIITRSPIDANNAIHEILDNPDEYDDPIISLAENEPKLITKLLSGNIWEGEGNLSRAGHEVATDDPLTEISKLLGKELTPTEEEFYDDVIFSIATSNMNLRWAQQGKSGSDVGELITANAVEEIIHLSPKWVMSTT